MVQLLTRESCFLMSTWDLKQKDALTDPLFTLTTFPNSGSAHHIMQEWFRVAGTRPDGDFFKATYAIDVAPFYGIFPVSKREFDTHTQWEFAVDSYVLSEMKITLVEAIVNACKEQK